jgi:plasmid stabilization system protein ParE
MTPDFTKLATLLKERLRAIADHELRDRDPAAHLKLLQEASEALEREAARLGRSLPPRLHHFMAQASYGKALEFLEGTPPPRE